MLTMAWAKSKGKVSESVLSQAFISLKHCYRSFATAELLNSLSRIKVIKICILRL